MGIGPAGENKVLFASITDESGRSYGRGGVGAVMGSKNLKAIRLTGKAQPEIADKDIYDFINYEAGKMVKASPRVWKNPAKSTISPAPFKLLNRRLSRKAIWETWNIANTRMITKHGKFFLTEEISHVHLQNPNINLPLAYGR